MSTDWTSSADLRANLEGLWLKGRLLTDETLFPLVLKLRRPDGRTLSEHFDEVRSWIRDLEREAVFRIEWTEIDHRVLGRNRVPSRVVIAERSEALRLIGRSEDAERFRLLTAATAERLPELREWVSRKPLIALENFHDWNRILEVLLWFRANPRCGLYMRQLEISGIDTKFIEARKPLFAELLDRILAPANGAVGPRWFEHRYGLASKPLQVRFRVLDRGIAIRGLTDLTLIVEEMAALDLQAKRVYITENEINGLAFPPMPDSIVIFGLGYGVEILSRIPWLADRELHYWGDIDTYGFHMLDRLRASFRSAQSFLMDRQTFFEHKALWVTEANPYRGPLGRLTESERGVYAELHGMRLEQERIPYGWVINAVRRE